MEKEKESIKYIEVFEKHDIKQKIIFKSENGNFQQWRQSDFINSLKIEGDS